MADYNLCKCAVNVTPKMNTFIRQSGRHSRLTAKLLLIFLDIGLTETNGDVRIFTESPEIVSVHAQYKFDPKH